MATLLLAVCIGLAGATAETTVENEVTIAVRTDAAPFTWVDRKGSRRAYRGFFWDICREATKRAGYGRRVVEINADQRLTFLTDGTLANASVDLLCDPTTITLARLENFDDLTGQARNLEYSPIVFITNGSFVQQSTPQPLSSGLEPIGPIDEFCTELRSRQLPEREPRDPRAWWKPRLFPGQGPPPPEQGSRRFEAWGYVAGSTIGDAVEQAINRVGDDRVICTFVQSSHATAATNFCEGRLHRYFGDVELVKAALSAYRESTGKPCSADESQTRQGTYEPYAFVVSTGNHPEFPERLTREVYRMFEDGTMDRLYRQHFPGTQKSNYLDILFRINTIPAGGN